MFNKLFISFVKDSLIYRLMQDLYVNRLKDLPGSWWNRSHFKHKKRLMKLYFISRNNPLYLFEKLDILLCMFSIMWGMHVQYFEINFRSSCYAYFAMNVLASFLNIVGYIVQMRSIVSSERTDESNWWCNFQIVHVHINYSVVNAR